MLKNLQAMLQKLGLALLKEVRAGKAQGSTATRMQAIGDLVAVIPQDSSLIEISYWEFPSSNSPISRYLKSRMLINMFFKIQLYFKLTANKTNGAKP